MTFLNGVIEYGYTLKPLTTLIYSLQNYESVVRFLPYSKEHRLVPFVAYVVALVTMISYVFFCVSYSIDIGLIFRGNI